MEGKYHILGITTEGKRNYWTGSGWSEVLTDSKIFTDLDDARDEWWEVTGNGKKLPEGFRRIIVPNYPEENSSAKEDFEDADNSHSDFVIENGILKKYNGKESELVIPNNVTSIGDRAFEKCDSLTSVVIGNSVTSIGDEAFKDCDSLTNIRYNGTKKQWRDISKDDTWKHGVNATIYCTDGVISLRLDEGSTEEVDNKLVQMPGTQGNWGEKHWGNDSAGFDMKSLVEDFQKYLSNQRRYDNVWYSGKPDSFTVDVDGDWKHDHLYMDMLVEEFLNDRGLTLADVQARTTEEDGSDWYRAERTYRIKVPKTGELTAGQIAKKINDKFNDSLSSDTGGSYNVKNVKIYNPDYRKAEESIKGQASSNFSRKSVYESIIGRR